MLTQTTQKRNDLYDIAKAIAIIAVVAGHIRTTDFTHRFIYLFHMIFFFVIAGYFFKEKYYSSFKSCIDFIKNKFLRLMIPYFLFRIIAEFFHNFLVNAYIIKEPLYNNIKDAFFNFLKHMEFIVNPIWFLFVLFFVLAIFCFINYFCAKIKVNFEINRLIIVLSYLLLGFYLSKGYTILWSGAICSIIVCVYIGFLLSKTEINNFITKPYFFLSFGFLILLTFLTKKCIVLGSNDYYNPALLILLSLISFIFVLSFAKIIENTRIKNVMSYIGKHTMPILILHTAALKFAQYIKITVCKEPLTNMLNVPDGNILWIIFYITVGVVLPLLSAWLYFFIKNSVEKRFPKKA